MLNIEIVLVNGVYRREYFLGILFNYFTIKSVTFYHRNFKISATILPNIRISVAGTISYLWYIFRINDRKILFSGYVSYNRAYN